MFITVFVSMFLNGYFVAFGFIKSMRGGYESRLMNQASFALGACEAILFANVACSHIAMNIFFLIKRACSNKATFAECQSIAEGCKELSTLSILRKMPSLEIISSAVVNWREKLALTCSALSSICGRNISTKRRCNCCLIIFSLPVGIINLLAPFLSIFAVLIKIKQLQFAFESPPQQWSQIQILLFCAFLNQISGLRVLRETEQAAILHFVFSGSDASMSSDEVILMKTWWNVTICSAVSNLKLHWFDTMVFWFSLEPRTIQLLLKNHAASDDEAADGILDTVQENDTVLNKYDEEVMRLIMCRD